MESHQRLSLDQSVAKKLGIYAALGVGSTTFGATAADADIIYTDLRGGNEIVVGTGNSRSVGLDVDNDGNLDFQIGFVSNTFNYFGTVSHQANLSAAVGAPATNAFIGFDFYVHGVSVSNLPLYLAFSHLNYWYDFGQLAFHYTAYRPNSTAGQFDRFGVPGLAALRFEDGTGTTRFGWVELVHRANLLNGIGSDDKFLITRYAYGLDMPILVGQTSAFIPEPSTMTSIGLLALGAAGVAYRRRKNRDKGEPN